MDGKEMQPGSIYLSKQVVNNHLILELENRRVNIVEFTANFEASVNVELQQTDTYKKLKPLESFSIIQPFRKQVIGKLSLGEKYQLNSRFGINLLAVPVDVQWEYIRSHQQAVQKEVEQFIELDLDLDVDLLLNKEIRHKLVSNNCKYVDLEFSPNEQSIWGNQKIDQSLEIKVQWRRVSELYEDKKVIVCDNTVGDSVKGGVLSNQLVLGALQMLNTRVGLIERLVGYNQYNNEGIYKVQLYIGNWVSVTIDDFIPCEPLGDPLFSHYNSNLNIKYSERDNQMRQKYVQIWMLLVEKAIAKVMGGYVMLNQLYEDIFQIVTGCPNCLVSISSLKDNLDHANLVWCLQEDEVIEDGEDEDEVEVIEIINYNKKRRFQQGYFYNVYDIREYKGQFVYILNNFNKSSIDGQQFVDDSEFVEMLGLDKKCVSSFIFLSEKEMKKLFNKAISCYLTNLQEIRLRNKFMRQKNTETQQEYSCAKFIYQLEIEEEVQKVIIGFKQEHEHKIHVRKQRPLLDIGVVVVRLLESQKIEIIKYVDYQFTNYLQLELELSQGKYMLIPITTGCQFYQKSDGAVKLVDDRGRISDQFSSCLKDIYDRFDQDLNGILEKEEVEDLFFYLNFDIDYKEEHLSFYRFKKLIERYIRELGQKNDVDEVERILNEKLNEIDYEDLVSTRYRYLIFTGYSEQKLKVMVKENNQSDIDKKCGLLSMIREARELDNCKGIRLFYMLHPKVHGYSYAVMNDLGMAVQVELDSSESENMIFSSGNDRVSKVVQPDQLVVMQSTQAVADASQFVRKVKCLWNQI